MVTTFHEKIPFWRFSLAGKNSFFVRRKLAEETVKFNRPVEAFQIPKRWGELTSG
jgi:hypothetical protein